jgi:hypothetical protein
MRNVSVERCHTIKPVEYIPKFIANLVDLHSLQLEEFLVALFFKAHTGMYDPGISQMQQACGAHFLMA